MANLNLPPKVTGLIGGLGMTRVTVYNQSPAPDGKYSGCPHVHAICSEAYYVVEGQGYVELHDLDSGFQTVELETGTYFQFPPNTIHRIVCHEKLVILGIMSNAGLAENGDARIYFGPAIDQDPIAYKKAVDLVQNGLDGALERRDIAVRGYLDLLKFWNANRDDYYSELKRFIDLHNTTVRTTPEALEPYIENGPRAWARAATSSLSGNAKDTKGMTVINKLPTGKPRLGMCGTLQPVQANEEESSLLY